ncbi:MAG: hypothetical protein ACTSYF_07025 [Promethearchaeota archaeon]
MVIDTTFNIDWDRQDPSGIGGLSEEKKEKLSKSVERMNRDLLWLRTFRNNGVDLIPKFYENTAKKIAKEFIPQEFKANRSNAEIVTTIEEELLVVDREKARAYYAENIAAQIFTPVTSPLGKVKFEIKQYGIKKATDVVKFTRSFSEPRYVQVQISNQTDDGIGLYGGYSITKMQLIQSQGELFDLEFELARELSEQLGRAMNSHIFTGTTTIEGIPMDDGETSTQYTGFLNHGSTQDFTIGTGSTWGSWIKGFKSGLSTLKTVRGERNIICIMSSGCLDQMQSNYPSYGNGNYNEWDEVTKRYSGIIKQFWVSDKLLGSTLDASHQAVILIDVEKRYMDRKIFLPLQTWSSLEKQWDNDIKRVMLVGDIIRHKLRPDTSINAFPVTKEDGITTATTGSISETRVA